MRREPIIATQARQPLPDSNRFRPAMRPSKVDKKESIMERQASLVVFSHLRWDFVFQRPQHLLSRMARCRPVIFVEEPILDTVKEPHFELMQIDEHLIVLRPHSPIDSPGFSQSQLPVLRELLSNFIAERSIRECIAWFYTPMALPLLSELPHQVVVYDCMDALDAFMNAPPLLKQREQELLEAADLVFTGGPSLFRRLDDRHANVHCFSSSVDAAHFAQAKSRGTEPIDQRSISHPRLGYFGVIDERIDLQLLDSVAEMHPHWQIVMVGPVVKISAADLPRRANIHYLGQKQYAELPDYVAGWDVCLLPFARNESTKFISPTKTLEYMAAEKPIVSTPITDVAVPYGHIIPIEYEPERFATACQEALVETTDRQTRRIAQMNEVLAATSWERTTNEMLCLMDLALASKQDVVDHKPTSQKAGAPQSSSIMDTASEATSETTESETSERLVVVIGAGPTGLSAAYHLGKQAILLDQNDKVGGWCRSVESDGFIFDFAGHIMFSNDPYVHQLYEMLLGDNVHWQDREAWVYSKQTYTRYPFQAALYGLPADVIKECILGAVEAKYGLLNAANGKQPPSVLQPDRNQALQSTGEDANQKLLQRSEVAASESGRANNGERTSSSSACVEGDVKDCCGDGVMETTAPIVDLSRSRPAVQGSGSATTNGASNKRANGHDTGGEGAAGAKANGRLNGFSQHTPGKGAAFNDEAPKNEEPKNFEEFIYKVWGAGIAKHFAVPYNRKLWAVPLDEMETSWLGGRVPMPDLGEMLDGALKPVGKPMGPNARFGYPLRGGFQSLMNGFLPHLEGQLLLKKKVVGVSCARREVTLNDGRVIPYEQLVSTMPLPVLIKLMGDEVPSQVQQAAAGLRHVSVRCVNLGIGREKLTEKHWIYYPEETVFHRIFVQGNASPHCNRPGGFGLTCEITYSPHKPLPCDGEALIQRCIDDCKSVGMIREDDPVWTAMQIDMPFAYVVYDHARPKNVAIIREWLRTQSITLAGRYSEWEYYNSDHAFIAGRRAAEEVIAARQALSTVGLIIGDERNRPCATSTSSQAQRHIIDSHAATHFS